jgi:RNA polymerase sigma-70 factor (ECF subfamily)
MQIMALLNARDESALSALTEKYGGACRNIAAQILGSEEDAEEILNDALLRMWNAIPPEQPDDLFAYLCTAVRRLAYQRIEKQQTQKRGGGQRTVSLDDAAAMQLPDAETPETLLDLCLTVDAVNRFLRTLTPQSRAIFVQRYGSGLSVREIAAMYRLTQSKVLVTLMRTRNRLRTWLKEEDLL